MTFVVNVNAGEEWDVLIDRNTKWGNPFVIGRDGNRYEVIEKFRQYLKTKPELVAEARVMLKDKRLGCHCKPADCHGDVWVEVLDA